MNRFPLFFVVVGALACAGSVRAQTIQLRDGQAVATLGVRRDGATVAAKIKTGNGTEGEVGYPVANIARIEFPDPAQRKIATDLLAQNRPDEALRQLTPVVAYYAPFRDLPGSWWTPLAMLQLDALSRLNRDRDAEALTGELARMGAANPEILRSVKIRQGIALERKGDHAKALAVLEPIVNDDDVPPATIAEAWLNVGAAKLAQRDFRDALLAYLHIPVYNPERANFMPTALLGSAVAYVGLDDKTRAESTLKDLIARFPNSPEAGDAKARLKKLLGPAADKTAANG